MKRMSLALVQARIKRLTDEIIRDSGALAPSRITPPPDDQPIDDGGEYGDPFEDRTPDFVKEALHGWVSMPGPEE
jgi:hypothetical protein